MILAAPKRQPHMPLKRTTLSLAGNVLLAVSALGASPQSLQLEQQLYIVASDYARTASGMRNKRKQRFLQLAQRWKQDTQWLSSSTDIAMHPDYQAIIGMGPDALPLILEDLRENSGNWYWALKSISNEDPVAPRDRGMIKKMKDAWLKWGEAKGLVSS